VDNGWLHPARGALQERDGFTTDRLNCAPRSGGSMYRFAVLLLTIACSAAVQARRATAQCRGTASCGRERLVEADQALLRAVSQRGVASAFAERLLDDAKLLEEGKGMIAGKESVLVALRATAPFSWTLASADVSGNAELGCSFGWMAKEHYAAVWRQRDGEWKLAVFMHKRAEPQKDGPPAWFVPFRGEPEPRGAARHSVFAADAAFAALAKQAGTQVAFASYAAQDAVQLARTIVFGRDAIRELFNGAPLIQWGPVAGEAAQDLGYTIGAYTAGNDRGNYLTIWRLQPDGSWRYVLDGGVSG
jgi:hypothetical protein